MTIRNLPEIHAFERPAGVDWDCPVSAREKFEPLAAIAATDRASRSIMFAVFCVGLDRAISP
jgi:hypothetical protein